MSRESYLSELKKQLADELSRDNSDKELIVRLSNEIAKLDKTNDNKIPFKVSARTARLIGRENIATSKGAIIELVKNGYDADSPISIVYFDNKYSQVQSEISSTHYEFLIKSGIAAELINSCYQRGEEEYILRQDVEDETKNDLKRQLARLASLYIIDAGEGMTQKIIREHWMTIGTDNKAYDIFTKSGRVKAGAKGIGRFALDKLGSNCEMITIFNPTNHVADIDYYGTETDYSGYNWKVNWEAFLKEYIVDVHTLNHDLFFERLDRTEWINGELCDGFEELGSPYYGKLLHDSRSYKCRLERYTGKYNTKLRLYKLHGSKDYYLYSRTEGSTFIPETYIKGKWGIGSSDFYKEKKIKIVILYMRIVG